MFIRAFWKSILWATIIFLLSSIPGKNLDKANIFDLLYIDKLVHVFLYFILTILLIPGFKKFVNFLSERSYLVYSLVISLFYGMIIEIFQLYVFHDRSAEFMDIVANLAGALIATFYYAFFTKNDEPTI